ncbi:MAG: calcium-binding protein, partial [Pseudomonadales bacterium]
QSRRNKFKFEGLEPRLLFSADPLTALIESATNMELTVENDSVLLRNLDDQSVIAQQLLADTNSVLITGSLGDDTLTINDAVFANGNTLSVTFEGGDGADSIFGGTLTGDINWGFVGYDTGEEDEAGDVFFKDIESLVAGTGTNTLFGDDVDRNWVLSEVDAKTQIETTFFDGTAGASTFIDFDAIIAGLENDYIVDQSNASSWDITNIGSGAIDGFNFDNFEFLTGGSSLDTLLNFSTYAHGVNVDLTADADNDNYGYATGFEGILGFEHVTGSAYGDWIFGDSASNTIIGLDGDDTLKGGAGLDNLQGGDGMDIFIAERNANLHLYNTELRVDAVKEDDISDFENANLIGGVDGNVIDASNFTLGYVVLDGRDGDDVLTGTTFDDTLTGGLGVDSFDGGSGGIDTVSESHDANFTLTDSALTIGSDAADTLTNIDAAILVGGDGDNIMNAAAFSYSTTIDGGAGADTITGSSADDIITGGLGDDTIDGLGGNDSLVEQGGGNFVLNNTSLVHQSNEVQSVAITGSTQGSYTITFNDGSTTATTQAIAFNAETTAAAKKGILGPSSPNKP